MYIVAIGWKGFFVRKHFFPISLQVRFRSRLRRLQKRLPEKAAVRAHLHAAGPVFGSMSTGVAG